MIAKLKCPCCGAAMIQKERSLLCLGERVHCYDLAKEGYVHMAMGQAGGGDSADAVRSRTDFLNTQAYRPVAERLCALLHRFLPEGNTLVDAGCGEGYYGCMAAVNGFTVLGVDLSKAAVRAAAKRASREGCRDRTLFAVGNVFDLPIADSAADGVINVFAPCVESEFCRVLRTEGVIAVVSAGPRHLMGLKQALYDRVYENDDRADMPAHMQLLCEDRLTYRIQVQGQQQIQNLFSMTPYYWRTRESDRHKLAGLEVLETEVDIRFSLYQKTV